MSALTVMGGTAAFATEGPATVDNGGSSWGHVDQSNHVLTAQLGLANTGHNDALNIVGNANLGRQHCDTDVGGGNILLADENNTARNDGGACTNTSTATNDGTGDATINSGDADVPNGATTTLTQDNSGGSSASNSADNNTLTADDAPATVSNGGSSHLWVDQHARVTNLQAGYANSGHNTAVNAVIGVNASSQTGSSSTHGGNLLLVDDGNTAGNTGGAAGNTSTATNTGHGTASITTGNASAGNTSTTTVTQTNSGGSSATNTANGNTLTSG